MNMCNMLTLCVSQMCEILCIFSIFEVMKLALEGLPFSLSSPAIACSQLHRLRPLVTI
jgi:hypothetical protein